MPLQATSGAASYDAFGGGVPVVPNYIEDVFQTWLYTGNNTSQTITNGVDLSNKGGLVWIKSRAGTYVREHYLYDTARGTILSLSTDTTGANVNNSPNGVSAYNTTGFDIVGSAGSGGNGSGTTYASWTFRKQPKFFDIQTWTGDGTSGRQISHNLGSVPGCVIVKRTNSAADWVVYHRSLSESASYSYNLFLNLTLAQANDSLFGLHSQQTSTQFKLGSNANAALINNTGDTYEAYIFAHDAGGFGLTGTDNVISCGSATGDPATYLATVNLGWEPQWVLTKSTTAVGNWQIIDNMRGMTVLGSVDSVLFPNSSSAESSTNAIGITSTGFITENYGAAFIYIAIRRGPMKVPTSGTSVFTPVAVASSTSNGTQIANSFVTDMAIGTWRDGVVEKGVNDRLRGISTTNPSGSGNPLLKTNTTGAETTPSNIIFQGNGNATMLGQYFAGQGYNQIYWLFGRAPSFFDEVCVTGASGTVNTASHNLGVVPELVIQKYRGMADDWYVFTNQTTGFLNLNSTSARIGTTNYMTTTTSTVVNTSLVSNPANNPVIYLFATCAGVSKVGSYTGTATTKQIDCGFTGGARFVLIKRTDSTGDWYVWDSARGIVAGNDPYLLLNSTAAEVTNTDYIDTYSAGFELSSTAPAAINASGGNFIFLAIA